jgi:hypothetical protein
VSDEVEAEQQDFDAVIVIREFNEGGAVGTKIVLNGDIKATEVQTILELGIAGWRRQIGV